MSDELRLPDDLAACEARLAAQSLPASGINRDELMYRAGWAACEARLATLTLATPLPRRAGVRLAAWSAASAIVAASLAVWATWHWRPLDIVQVAVKPRDSDPAMSAAVTVPRLSTALAATTETEPRDDRVLPAFDVGLLGRRREALSQASLFNDRVASAQGELPAPAAKTARELLDELLPAAASARTPSWPWNKRFVGDSI